VPVLVAGVLLAGAAAVLIAPDGGHQQASPGKASARPPVVFLMMDEFPVDALRGPDGSIDAARYPNFAALARTSTWFPDTQAVHDETPYALPAIMDGRLPRRGRVATAAGHPRSIFTLLGDRGYRVFQNQEATDICPNRLCPGAAKRRQGILANLARGRLERFNRWLRSISRRRQPALYLKHTLVPHLPWVFLPSGQKLKVTLGHLASPRGFHDRGLTLHNEKRFLLQVGFADRELGRLIGTLRRQRLFDRALIVVTADHGMSFDVGVNDRRKLSRRNIDEIAPVPFFLKAPGQTVGRVESGYGRTVDIVPTVADVLGLPLDWRADGRSRLAAAPPALRVVRMPRRFFDGAVRIRTGRLDRRRSSNVRRRARRFGTGAQSSLLFGSPWATVYRAGPRPGLVGRSVSGLSVRPAPVAARFSARERWRSVSPRAGRVPAQVAGWIPGGHRAGRRVVAVAVNGRIQAVAGTFRLRGSRAELFSLIVPVSSLHRGRNRVEVLEVAGRGRSPRLLRLARSS
jgi:hypothetical protein